MPSDRSRRPAARSGRARIVRAGLLALAVCAPAQPAGAEPPEKHGRSSFAYADGRAAEPGRYRQPRLDVDPTDLSVEELRARMSALEERVEHLERVLRSVEAAAR